MRYAVAEIFLLVVGILIALQINNWNENLQVKREEHKTLKSLQESIKNNIVEFDTIFDAQILRSQSIKEALLTDISEKSSYYLDSLVRRIVSTHTFDPSSGVYYSIINSGKLELISNDTLKARISRLYDLVRDYQESEDEVTAYTEVHLEQYFIENYSIDPMVLAGVRKRTAQEEQNDKANYVKNITSQKAKNVYILLLKKMENIFTKGQNLDLEYNSLLNQLETEILK
ncbi:MAG: DUF6090 family protein [Croceivirga sp.]